MRENGFRAIGGLAQKLTSGMAKGRDASVVRLKAEWSAVVGPELARVTRPDALLSARGARSSRSGSGKVLRLKVSGAAALEVQHRSSQIVERVNAYFGHRLIDELRLVQGVIAAPPAKPKVKRPDAAVEREIANKVADVKDPELRAALARLGARITTGRRSLLIGGLGALFLGDDLRAQ